MSKARGSTGITRVAALVAALMLVLQSALAVAAPPVQRDIFGNIICVDGSTGQSPASDDHGGGHMPDCCLLACGAPAHAAPALPAALSALAVARPQAPANPPATTVPSRPGRRTPANPRAPPAAA